jgi:lipoprotein NlpI
MTSFHSIAFVAATLYLISASTSAVAADLASPTPAELEARGGDLFRAGKFAASVAAFDEEIRLDPRRAPWHWKRGISLYYAGHFADGAKQFEGYQTVDGNDVENAVWRFLCQVRDPAVGLEKARQGMLVIKDDRRVPMRQIYDLYAGKATPDDVIAAVKADDPSKQVLRSRLFYANLYLGLYHESNGGGKLAESYIEAAAGDPIDHYMGDVAKVHAKLIADQPKRQVVRPSEQR